MVKKATKKKKAQKKFIESKAPPIVKKEDMVLLPTGCTYFNLALGGGFKNGRIINLVGDNSTGKTLIAIEFIAACRKILGNKLKWFYDDVEARFDYDTKKMYGFEILSEEDKKQSSDMLEDFELTFQEKIEGLKHDEYLIYVLDSLDALSSEAARERYKKRLKAIKDNTKQEGSFKLEKVKDFGEFFRIRKKDIRDKNILFLVISQVRSNIGVTFGAKYYRTGGKALDHFASQIIWLAEAEKIGKTVRGLHKTLGITTKARITKNSVGKPFRDCLIDITFEKPYGIDDVATNIDYLYRLKTDSGKMNAASKRKLEWDGEEFTRDELICHIEEFNLEEELIKRVTKDWDEVEEIISQEHRKGKF